MADSHEAPAPDSRGGDRSRPRPRRRRSRPQGERGRPPGEHGRSHRSADLPADAVSKGHISLSAISIPFLAVMAAAAFCYFARPILVPLVTALTLAYILSPVVAFLSRKVPRWIAVLAVVSFAVALLAGVGFLVIQQGERLVKDAPAYLELLNAQLSEAESWTQQWPEPFSGMIRDAVPDLKEQLGSVDLQAISSQLFAGLGSVLGFLGWASLVALLAVFILLDMPQMQRQLIRVMGPRHESAMKSALEDIDLHLRAFLSVKIGISAALGVVATIGLLFLGVPYAWVWGPLTGVLNVVPYVGGLIAAVPPVIMVAIQSDSLLPAVLVAVFLTVLQQIEGNFVTPKLLANRIQLNAVSVLVATMVWGWLWGALGVLLAVPITAMIKVVCDRVEPLRPIAVLLG